jgi:hypothetical protein
MDAELLLRTANRTDITAGMRGFFLNDAYLKIANEFEHRELQGLTTFVVPAGASSASATVTNIWWPDLVRNVTDGVLLAPEDKEKIVGAALASGPPARFYWYGNLFYVDRLPTVDTTLQVWYTIQPVDLGGTDLSVLGQIFDVLIVMTAAQIAFETVRDFAEAHIQEVTASNYVSRQKLPLRQLKLNDHRTGIRVRMR